MNATDPHKTETNASDEDATTNQKLNWTPEELGIQQEELQNNLNIFAQVMTQGIRRWEKVIYPMMVGFILLAIYGFYLVYSMANVSNKVANDMGQMTKVVTTQLTLMQQDINNISKSVLTMKQLNQNVVQMNQNMSKINESMRYLNYMIYNINQSTRRMSGNMQELNQNISTPMRSMNNMMPWSMFNGKPFSGNHAPPRYPVTPHANTTQPNRSR